MSSLRIGLDSGSRTTKLVLWNADSNIIEYRSVVPTGVRPEATVQAVMDEFYRQRPDLPDTIPVCATGYGRNLLKSRGRVLPEITCQARGIHRLLPAVRTIIDIGGQDSKIITLDDEGQVIDFAMNDKCAAGTGRFLEVVAHRLEISVDHLGEWAEHSGHSLDIDSTCAVFAESEIIGLIAQGIAGEDIAAAVHRSVARRQRQLSASLVWRTPLALTGGVAQNEGMRKAIAECFECEVEVPADPEITAALGAALSV